jgi:hypothetical protein
MLVAAIKQLLELRSVALLANDVDALARLLDHDYSYVDSLGRHLLREAYLLSRRTGEVRLLAQRIEDIEVRPMGTHIALATATTRDVGLYEGREFRAAYRVVHVCRFDGAAWRFLFGQSTTMEEHA